jgi:4-alpha-glucanotransferase
VPALSGRTARLHLHWGVSVPTLSERRCGILLHPTSLPGPGDAGELGSAARRFVDFLVEAGQSWWQMLPVGPTGYGNSPYSALSAFAGNPALVSLERLRDDELIGDDQVRAPREQAMRAAFDNLRRRPSRDRDAFEAFREASRAWLDDFTLYRAIKRAHREVQWTLWDPELRDRRPDALGRARRDLADEMAFYAFEQHRFHLDWLALRADCHARGVGLIGDLPIFVAHDSADVWQHRELFHLDQSGNPTVIAGVPPDYFSATGQRWGNPLYRWPRLRQTGYRWWLDRFRLTLSRFDAVRLDHFIGFQRYWEIPASEPTAQNGRWMKGPGADFFNHLQEALGTLPLIAEDLGAVTPAVTRLRRQFGLPGIRLLQFAFGTDPQAPLFLPHNYKRHEVVYTGTHDNDTTVGWFQDRGGPGTGRSPEQAETERRAVLLYTGARDEKEIHWDMIRTLYMSVANLAVVPLQDVLGLGTEARMNRPGVALGNWGWRFADGALTTPTARRLAELAQAYGRGRAP